MDALVDPQVAIFVQEEEAVGFFHTFGLVRNPTRLGEMGIVEFELTPFVQMNVETGSDTTEWAPCWGLPHALPPGFHDTIWRACDLRSNILALVLF